MALANGDLERGREGRFARGSQVASLGGRVWTGWTAGEKAPLRDHLEQRTTVSASVTLWFWVSSSCSWHRTPKPWEFVLKESDRIVFCYVHKVTWESSEDGVGYQGNTITWLEGWNFQPHPDLQGWERSQGLSSVTRCQWCNQPWLCNEASVKSARMGFTARPGWWASGDCGERCTVGKPGGHRSLCLSAIWEFLSYILLW